jgi:hypothetical protein
MTRGDLIFVAGVAGIVAGSLGGVFIATSDAYVDHTISQHMEERTRARACAVEPRAMCRASGEHE